jgi:hypothetical protein
VRWEVVLLPARRQPERAAEKESDEGLPQASGGRNESKDDARQVTKVADVKH